MNWLEQVRLGENGETFISSGRKILNIHASNHVQSSGDTLSCSFRGILPSEYEQVIHVAPGLSSRKKVKGPQRKLIQTKPVSSPLLGPGTNHRRLSASILHPGFNFFPNKAPVFPNFMPWESTFPCKLVDCRFWDFQKRRYFT